MTAFTYARFQEDERPEPAQLIDFAVDVDGIDLKAGPHELVARDKFRLFCKWAGSVIEIDRIESSLWLGRGRLQVCPDVSPDPNEQALCRMIREHYATDAGQQFLRAECDGQETELRWVES